MLLSTSEIKLNPNRIIFSYVLTELNEKKSVTKSTIEVDLETINKLPRITEKDFDNLSGEDYQKITIITPDGFIDFVLYHNPQDSIGHIGVFVLKERQTKFVSKKKEERLLWPFALPFFILAFIFWGTDPMVRLVGNQITFWIMLAMLFSASISFIIICLKTK